MEEEGVSGKAGVRKQLENANIKLKGLKDRLDEVNKAAEKAYIISNPEKRNAQLKEEIALLRKKQKIESDALQAIKILGIKQILKL